MAVSITNALRKALLDSKSNPQEFIDAFALWKECWPAFEYESELFGKESAYGLPLVDGKPNLLMHVHLVPIRDQVARGEWYRRLFHRRRKVSDRALVYVESARHDFLLIAILEEGDAHRVCQMRTPEDVATMEGFAFVAEKFLFDGSIVA